MEKEKTFDYWYFLRYAMYEIREQLQAATGFSYVLNNDEYHPLMADDDRRFALDKLDEALWQMYKQLNTLVDLSYYSGMQKLECNDRVLVNKLCWVLMDEQDVKVLFRSDIPDYYAVRTNEEALKKILVTLLRAATERVLHRHTNSRAQQVFLTVTEHGDEGKLTFAVSDTGDVTSRDDDITTFDPPTARHGHSISEMIGYYNCRLMVKLLGGFIYIDPDYREGRRIIFDISVKQKLQD